MQIVGEDVRYLDADGNLVRQDILSLIRQYVVTQYPSDDDFTKAWLINRDKKAFASDLLLETDWTDNFKTRYGYDVDVYDIIRYIAYGIEPPMSKHQRIQSAAIARYLESYSNDMRVILHQLLRSYERTNDFDSLKNIKAVFGSREFADLGYTPMKVMKMFGSREKYYKVLNELENKLYE